jgi:hypothetical protein
VIAKIGTHQVDQYQDSLNDPAIFNPIVSGIVPIGVAVHQDIAMQSTGNNLGVKQIEILIDKRVVLTQRTDAEVAAPGVATTLNLDTRQLSNGTHEIFLRAYNTRCTPSIADYGGAGADSGGYFPLHINVRNSAAAAIAPSASKQVFLPAIMYLGGSSVPNSCVSAMGQAAGQPFGAGEPFVLATRAAVRDEQQLLICDL